MRYFANVQMNEQIVAVLISGCRLHRRRRQMMTTVTTVGDDAGRWCLKSVPVELGNVATLYSHSVGEYPE